MPQEGELDLDQGVENRALAANKCKDLMLFYCPYYDALVPIMGNCPNNLLLASSETPALLPAKPPPPPPPSTLIESNPSKSIDLTPLTSIGFTDSQTSPMANPWSTQLSGWFPTLLLNSNMYSNKEFNLPGSIDDLIKPSQQTKSNENIKSDILSQTFQQLPSSQLQTPARDTPSSNLGQTPKSLSRQSSGSAALLKLMKSSLLSQTYFQEMNQNMKETNNTN
ncbi:hypothetical protein DFH28DRAFT_1128753 [Melampsora americana]|nr:hypothetical protein DFH28DRAFT_1128753 [Melampsora americana]